jgi:hypothetical protein
MSALQDTESYPMPVCTSGQPMFRSEFWVSYNEDDTVRQLELHLSIPEYMEGQTMEGDSFIYDSCGFLKASLNDMMDEFIDDCRTGLNEMRDAMHMRHWLAQNLTRLDAFIAEEGAGNE